MTERRCIMNQVEAEEIFGDRARECNSCPCDAGLALRNKPVPVIEEPVPDVEQAPAPVIRETETTHHKEKTMAIKPRGKCANCGRPNMALTNAKGTGLCGSCHAAVKGISSLNNNAAWVSALAERKNMFAGTAKGIGTRRGLHKATVEGKPNIKPQSGASTEGIPPPAPVKVEGNSIPPPPSSSDTHRNTLTPADLPRHEQGSINLHPSIRLLFITNADAKLLAAIEDQARQYRRTPDQQILWICQNDIQLREALFLQERENYEQLVKEAEGNDGGQ